MRTLTILAMVAMLLTVGLAVPASADSPALRVSPTEADRKQVQRLLQGRPSTIRASWRIKNALRQYRTQGWTSVVFIGHEPILSLEKKSGAANEVGPQIYLEKRRGYKRISGLTQPVKVIGLQPLNEEPRAK